MQYVDPNADLNIQAPIKPLMRQPNCGPHGSIPDKVRRAGELLEKGFQVKEKLYNILLSQDEAFFQRLLAAKPEATLNYLAKVLPQDNTQNESAEKKMPILIINNSAQAAVA